MWQFKIEYLPLIIDQVQIRHCHPKSSIRSSFEVCHMGHHVTFLERVFAGISEFLQPSIAQYSILLAIQIASKIPLLLQFTPS